MMKMKNRNILARTAVALICVLTMSFASVTVMAEETAIPYGDMQKGAGLAEKIEKEKAQEALENGEAESEDETSEDEDSAEYYEYNAMADQMMRSTASASVSITKDFCSMKIGSSQKLEYKVSKSGMLTWKTTDSSVCTVSSDGTVTAKSKGFAIVWAKHQDGTYDYCKIFSGYYIGADISSYQPGADWDMIKSAGFDFVILRAGYGNDASTQTDEVFYEYYNEAKRVGIPVGVYWFNYTESVNDAHNEAAAFWSVVKNKEFEMGYWADYEQDSYRYYKDLYGVAPSVSLMTNMVTTFLADVKSRAGEYYPVGYYSSMSPLIEWFGSNLKDNWPLWGAYYEWRTEDSWEDGYNFSTLFNYVEIPPQYTVNTDYMTMLQYTSSEHCRKIGLSGGGLDMDVIPMDSPMALRFVTASADSAAAVSAGCVTVSWQKPENAETVDGYAVLRKEAGGNWKEIGTVSAEYYDSNGNAVNENTGYSFEDTTVTSGAEYYYTVRAYAMSGSQKIYSLCDEEGVYCKAFFGGDVDLDGDIDAIDYAMIRNHVSQKSIITEENALKMADFNGDGNIDAQDYSKVREYIMSN